MVEKQNSKIRVQTLIGAILALLVVLPVIFISSSVRTMARNNFDRNLVRSKLLLQHEMLSFKLDLIPRYQVQRLIREVEEKAQLLPLGQNIPQFSPGQLPDIYNAQTAKEMLKIFRRFKVKPLFLCVISADVKDYFTWYGEEFPWLDEEARKLLEARVACYITDLRGLKSVCFDDQAAARFQQLLDYARGPHKNFADAFYYSFRDAFADMAYSPRFAASTYEICGDRFGSLRLFVHYNRIKDQEKFYGGYFVVFASRDLPPEILLKRALKSKTGRCLRTYSISDFSQENLLVLSSPISAEILGYSQLFPRQVSLPEKIYAVIDISNELSVLKRTENRVSFITRLVLLTAFALFFRFHLFAIPQSSRIRRKMLMIVSVVVIVPYLILGNMARMILRSLDNLKIEEIQAEIDRNFAELESYYSDQKLQHLIRIFYAKEQLIKNINLSQAELMELDAFEVVEPDFHANVYIYRNDGFSRKFTSGHRNSKRANRFYSNFGARYLENLGFLDKNSGKARKDSEMARLTDGFLSELRQGNLEHRIISAEGCETRDISKIDDFSRMICFLIPQSHETRAKIRGIAFANVADINTNVYQQHFFHPQVFRRQSLFSQARMSLGLRRPDGSISRWWPGEIGPVSKLKELLDFAALTQSSGQLLIANSEQIIMDGWRFESGESTIFSGRIQTSPDLLIQMLVRVFPLLLILFTIISAVLFSDVLNSLFVTPVQGFARAAMQIKEGNYLTRIETRGVDEFARLGRSFNIMTGELQQRERLRRFISEDLFHQIRQNKENLINQKLQESVVTVLASDIRNFTTITERYPAEEVVMLLNDYFTEMEAAITGYGGFIVRFIGDAVIAVFQGGDRQNSAFCAVIAAKKMRKALASLNERRRELGLFQIENGIGIASGQAIMGVAGSETGRKVFCVMGEVVETSEYLEILTKLSKYHKIVVCQQTANLVTDRVELVEISRPNLKLQAFDVIKVNND